MLLKYKFVHYAHYVYSENSVVNNLKQVSPPDFYFNLNSKFLFSECCSKNTGTENKDI